MWIFRAGFARNQSVLPRALAERQGLQLGGTGAANGHAKLGRGIQTPEFTVLGWATSANGISTRYESVLVLADLLEQLGGALGGGRAPQAKAFAPSQLALASAKPSPLGMIQMAFLRSSSGTNSTGAGLR